MLNLAVFDGGPCAASRARLPGCSPQGAPPAVGQHRLLTGAARWPGVAAHAFLSTFQVPFTSSPDLSPHEMQCRVGSAPGGEDTWGQ